jgi:hypothetical protein
MHLIDKRFKIGVLLMQLSLVYATVWMFYTAWMLMQQFMMYNLDLKSYIFIALKFFILFILYIITVCDVVRILNGRTILYNLIFNYCINKIKRTRIKIDIDKNY